jgi:hypothetical protein
MVKRGQKAPVIFVKNGSDQFPKLLPIKLHLIGISRFRFLDLQACEERENTPLFERYA